MKRICWPDSATLLIALKQAGSAVAVGVIVGVDVADGSSGVVTVGVGVSEAALSGVRVDEVLAEGDPVKICSGGRGIVGADTSVFGRSVGDLEQPVAECTRLRLFVFFHFVSVINYKDLRPLE